MRMDPIKESVEVGVSESVMQEAHQQKQDVAKFQKARNENTFDLGEVLHKIKAVYEEDEDNETYNGLQRYGFQYYHELLGAPEESGGLGISSSTADRCVRLYRKYILELGYEKSMISKFNYTKLDIISKAVTKKNLTHWIKILERSTTQDLIKEREKVIESEGTRTPGDNSKDPITTAIEPTTARDWIEAWDLVHLTVKETCNSPQDKQFVKEVYGQTLDLFKSVLERHARGSKYKRSSEKLLKAIETIVRTENTYK